MSSESIEAPLSRMRSIDGLETAPVRLTAAGEIDYDYYLWRARSERSSALAGLIRQVFAWFVGLVRTTKADSGRHAEAQRPGEAVSAVTSTAALANTHGERAPETQPEPKPVETAARAPRTDKTPHIKAAA